MKLRKEQRGAQKGLQESLAFPVSREPHIHIVISKYGPKEQVQLDQAGQDALVKRPLNTIPHSGSIRYAAIPNPNYRPGVNTAWYAAVRLPGCVSLSQRLKLLNDLDNLKDVRRLFSFFRH
jgi:hypothetical protein